MNGALKTAPFHQGMTLKAFQIVLKKLVIQASNTCLQVSCKMRVTSESDWCM
jgi:hypothetical protein